MDGEQASRFASAARIALASQNAYFVISTFNDDAQTGKALRRKALFRACHVIVVDDVGTKVDAGTLGTKLPSPSWSLETSPGNFQWGYILDTPETDAGRVNALLDGMVAGGLAADGKDPGMKGVTRYVRLPVGRNTKAKYGPRGFDCRLTAWEPSRRFKMDDLAALWGIVLPAPGAVAAGPTRGTAMDTRDDPVFSWLDQWGMVDGSRAADGVGWNITCPWLAHHTDRTDTGTAYWAGGAIKCHHGHCEAKGRAELLAWVNARLCVEEGTSLAGLDFKDADRPLLDAVWRVLATGGVLASQDMSRLVLVPVRDVDNLLRGARAILDVDTTPIRRALARARTRHASDARRCLRAAARTKTITAARLAPDTPAAVTLAEAQASVVAALAALPHLALVSAGDARPC